VTSQSRPQSDADVRVQQFTTAPLCNLLAIWTRLTCKMTEHITAEEQRCPTITHLTSGDVTDHLTPSTSSWVGILCWILDTVFTPILRRRATCRGPRIDIISDSLSARCICDTSAVDPLSPQRAKAGLLLQDWALGRKVPVDLRNAVSGRLVATLPNHDHLPLKLRGVMPGRCPRPNQGSKLTGTPRAQAPTFDQSSSADHSSFT